MRNISGTSVREGYLGSYLHSDLVGQTWRGGRGGAESMVRICRV